MTTTFRIHHHDGTLGAAATPAGEGYDASSGTAPVYVDGYTNQALRWTSGAAAAYLGDNLLAGYYDFILRLPTAPPGSDLGFILLQNSTGGAVGSLVVNSAGKLVIYTGQTAIVATSTTTLAVGAWHRLKYHCDADGQELRIFTDPAGSTPAETLTGASSGIATAKMHLGNPWTGKRGVTGDTVDLDEVQVSDGWIVPAPPATNLKIRIGGVAVPAIKRVRINGVGVTVTESISAGAVGDASLFSDTFSDTF